jgi:hypothetical protein
MEYHRQTLLIPQVPPNSWDAMYAEPSSLFYCNNRLIDALRPALSAKGLKNCLNEGNAKLPESKAEDGIRKQALRAFVNEYFIPPQEILDLYDKIDGAIKDGYKNKGSNNRNYQQQLINLSSAMKNNEMPWRDNTQQATRINSVFVYGGTGSGKSSATQRCLSFYPQVIWHKSMNQCQIVHLTVDLSGVQTPLEYCELFLKALENVLGPEKYGNEVDVSRNVSAALLKIESLVLTYNVGILVIDSLESINDWNDPNKVRLLKHFRALGKVIPILYCGNTDVFDSVALDMPWLFSAISFGSIHWDPLKRFDKTSSDAQLRWSLFTKRLWKQQCLRNATNGLTEEIRTAWYEASQGVMQLAVSFYSMCQIEAINSGEEQITAELMYRVRRKESKPIEHALKAYKNNDVAMLSILKGADRTIVEGNKGKATKAMVKTTTKKRKQANSKNEQPSQHQMPPGFKKTPKKDWGKLPESDLRYKFSKCEKGKFYDELKSSGLVLTMQDLMGNGQFSKPTT